MQTIPTTAILLAATLGTLTGCISSDTTGPEHATCDDFLLQYGTATGDTVTTQQGLKYIEINPGAGTAAGTGNTVDVNYSGYLLSGTPFDSSCPADATVFRLTLGASQVIPGFDLGVRGMKPNGVRRVIVPPALGYGNVANGPIPANSTLIFDLQLVRIVE